MAYVKRTDGKISGVFRWPQDGIPEEYLADDAAEVVAYLAPPASPQTLSRTQVVRQLAKMGALDAARAAVANSSALVQELWNATTFHRDDPTLTALAESKLGMKPTDMDAFFVAASEL